MNLDLENIALLLQRRYGILREIKKLTDELQEAVSRQDEVSLSLILQMRAEEIAKYDAIQLDLWSQAEHGLQEEMELKRLLKGEPELLKDATDFMEKKIYEIRMKMKGLIQQIQRQDQILTQRVNRKR